MDLLSGTPQHPFPLPHLFREKKPVISQRSRIILVLTKTKNYDVLWKKPNNKKCNKRRINTDGAFSRWRCNLFLVKGLKLDTESAMLPLDRTCLTRVGASFGQTFQILLRNIFWLVALRVHSPMGDQGENGFTVLCKIILS